jgi:hypothetical protein
LGEFEVEVKTEVIWKHKWQSCCVQALFYSFRV